MAEYLVLDFDKGVFSQETAPHEIIFKIYTHGSCLSALGVWGLTFLPGNRPEGITL